MLTVFMKHAKNFVSNGRDDICDFVMFTGKYAVATDTKTCVVIPFECKKQNIHYKTGKISYTEPVNWKKVIPKKYVGEIEISKDFIPQFIQQLKITIDMAGKYDLEICHITNDELLAKYTDREYKSKIQYKNIKGKFDVILNAKHVINILKFIKDMDVDFKIKFTDKLQPIVFEAGEAIIINTTVRCQ